MRPYALRQRITGSGRAAPLAWSRRCNCKGALQAATDHAVHLPGLSWRIYALHGGRRTEIDHQRSVKSHQSPRLALEAGWLELEHGSGEHKRPFNWPYSTSDHLPFPELPLSHAWCITSWRSGASQLAIAGESLGRWAVCLYCLIGSMCFADAGSVCGITPYFHTGFISWFVCTAIDNY
jgi:hypothetical protein